MSSIMAGTRTMWVILAGTRTMSSIMAGILTVVVDLPLGIKYNKVSSVIWKKKGGGGRFLFVYCFKLG